MRRVAQILCIVNLLALLSLPAITHADAGFYLGAQIMQGGDFDADSTTISTTVAGSQHTYRTSGVVQNLNADSNPTAASFAVAEYDAIWLLKGGYHFTERFAVEARYALTDDSHSSAPLTVNSTTIPVVSVSYDHTTTTTAHRALDEWYGVYGRLGFRGGARVRPYLLGGYASREITLTYSSSRDLTAVTDQSNLQTLTQQSDPATIVSSSTDIAAGLSVGAGLNIGFGKRVDFNVEWLNNDEGGLLFSGPAYSAFNAGLAFKF